MGLITSVDLDVPASALAVGAHPDDVEFGCGATLAKWARDGCVVHHLVLTDGSKGTWDVDADTAALIATRKDEQRAAARALGATGHVEFLDQPDGELESTLALREAVALVIRRLRPDVVLGHDPWRRYRLHPDHRHAGFLTVDAVVAARDPHFYRHRTLPHHRPSTLLLFEADDPDHLETASPDDAQAKLEALLSHTSQLRSTMHISEHDDGDELDAFRTRITERLAEQGALAGRPAGEAFRMLDPS